jgi:hypothetical protein
VLEPERASDPTVCLQEGDYPNPSLTALCVAGVE